jgi:predicted small metal-binding protein
MLPEQRASAYRITNHQYPERNKRMTYVVRCRDVGYDCEGVVRAATQEELLQQVAAHAQSAHGLQEVTPAVVEKVKSVIRVEDNQ